MKIFFKPNVSLKRCLNPLFQNLRLLFQLPPFFRINKMVNKHTRVDYLLSSSGITTTIHLLLSSSARARERGKLLITPGSVFENLYSQQTWREKTIHHPKYYLILVFVPISSTWILSSDLTLHIYPTSLASLLYRLITSYSLTYQVSFPYCMILRTRVEYNALLPMANICLLTKAVNLRDYSMHS